MILNNIIELLEPLPKICPNQISPKYPPAGNAFIKLILDSVDTPFSAISIDGYIVNDVQKITRLFFKREYRLLDTNLRPEEIVNTLTNCLDVKDSTPKLKALAQIFGCGIDFLFAPEGYPYQITVPNKMFLISVEAGANTAQRKLIDKNQLASHIRKFRGKAFKNSKNITVATSSIECFLANALKTSGESDPFPGDIDFLMFKNNIVHSVVEFKTHNLDSEIENQSYIKYPKEDKRRLQVLLNLVSILNCSLYYLFWGPNHEKIKIQQIDSQGQLVSESTFNKDAMLIARYLMNH